MTCKPNTAAVHRTGLLCHGVGSSQRRQGLIIKMRLGRQRVEPCHLRAASLLIPEACRKCEYISSRPMLQAAGS
jgi:hypothetical protein